MSASTQYWYPLRPHPVQIALRQDNVRFRVVAAGRRSGKSQIIKRLMIKASLSQQGQYFIAGPTRDQIKRIYWADLKAMSFGDILPLRISEAELIIHYPSGGSLHLLGLDVGARVEGVSWSGGAIDEIADVKPDAIHLNILPALDTEDPMRPGYRPWAIMAGVPNGLNHFYDLFEYARTANDPDWKSYHWTSAEILPKDLIEAARRRMSERDFRQEYEANFLNTSGRIYENFSDDNLTTEVILPQEKLYWCHDFNFDPLSSAVGVIRHGSLYFLDEIILSSSTPRQTATEFISRYKQHYKREVDIFGDASGKIGEKHGHPSSYIEIENMLREDKWAITRKVKPRNPAIVDRQNATRALIKNALGEVRLFINPKSCPTLYKGLKTLCYKQGSAYLEEETREQHVCTAINYMIEYLWPISSNRSMPDSKPSPTVNYWNRSAS